MRLVTNMTHHTYYSVANILKEQLVSKINKRDDLRESFSEFNTNHQLPNSGNCEMSLSQLRSLIVGDNLLAQFDIIEGKVASFLNDNQVGFLNVGKLYDDIVVGVVIGEYEPAAFDGYQDFVDEGLSRAIKELDNEGYNEYMLTIAGRHRIVGLTTVCDILGINTDAVIINVLVKTYENWNDAALAVLCANKSRSMTPAERTNCIVNSKGINTLNLTDLSSHASTGIKNAKEAFALACVNFVNIEKTTLTKNTVATVARTFITNIGKTKSGKKVISYLSDEKVLNALVNVFTSLLTDTFGHTNVARNASDVGRRLAEKYLNEDVTVNAIIVNKMVSHEDEETDKDSDEQTTITESRLEDSF